MPRIQMTRTVKFTLYFLRIYLVILLILILVKFIRVFGQAPASPGIHPLGSNGQTTASAAQVTTAPK